MEDVNTTIYTLIAYNICPSDEVQGFVKKGISIAENGDDKICIRK